MENTLTIDALFARAKAHNVAMAEICRRAQIDPTTPSRWKRRRNGATYDRLIRLVSALDQIIGELAAGPPQ